MSEILKVKYYNVSLVKIFVCNCVLHDWLLIKKKKLLVFMSWEDLMYLVLSYYAGKVVALQIWEPLWDISAYALFSRCN